MGSVCRASVIGQQPDAPFVSFVLNYSGDMTALIQHGKTSDATTTPSQIDFVFVDGLRYVLDGETKRLVIEVLDAAARGRAVHVRPLEDMLSTQEAADILKVSRPTLVKMLDDGLIEHERPGVHRRVPRSALEAFLAERRARRATAMEQLADTYTQDVDDTAEFVTTR